MNCCAIHLKLTRYCKSTTHQLKKIFFKWAWQCSQGFPGRIFSGRKQALPVTAHGSQRWACLSTCSHNTRRLLWLCLCVYSKEAATSPACSGSRLTAPGIWSPSAGLLSAGWARHISLQMSLPICGKFCFGLTLKDCRCRYVVIDGGQLSTALVQPVLETVRWWVPTCFAKLMTCPRIGYLEEWKEDQPGSWHLDSSPVTTDLLRWTWSWTSYSAALVPRFCMCEMREWMAGFPRSLCFHHSVIIPPSLAGPTIQFHVCVCVLVSQSCLTLCDPMDCRLPASSVHGILQERILEWVAISFSVQFCVFLSNYSINLLSTLFIF